MNITQYLELKSLKLQIYYCGKNDAVYSYPVIRNMLIYSVSAHVLIYNRNHFQREQYAWFYTTYVTDLPLYNKSNLYVNATLLGINYIKSGSRPSSNYTAIKMALNFSSTNSD